jgi:hypothetical protein
MLSYRRFYIDFYDYKSGLENRPDLHNSRQFDTVDAAQACVASLNTEIKQIKNRGYFLARDIWLEHQIFDPYLVPQSSLEFNSLIYSEN